jgi:hypothetical protein
MFDEATLKRILSQKQREADDAAQKAYEAKADQAAIERVLELVSKASATRSEALAETPVEPPQEGPVNAERTTRATLYASGKRPKRSGPPREGSIAAQSVAFVTEQRRRPVDLDVICDHLDTIRDEPVNRLSVDRILRREVKEGTLAPFGDKAFGPPGWRPARVSTSTEELQLN